MPSTKRATVYLESDLHRALRLKAAETDRTISELVNEAIRDSFVETVRLLLEGGSYVGIATHDEQLVDRAAAVVSRLQLEPSSYEYQMLYGVRPSLGTDLVRRGHKLRIYVPYGRHWYAYSLRRLRENPALAGYVLKGLFVR